MQYTLPKEEIISVYSALSEQTQTDLINQTKRLIDTESFFGLVINYPHKHNGQMFLLCVSHEPDYDGDLDFISIGPEGEHTHRGPFSLPFLDLEIMRVEKVDTFKEYM